MYKYIINNSKDNGLGQFTFKKERKKEQNLDSNENIISKSFDDKIKINTHNSQNDFNDYDAIVEKDNDSNLFFIFMCPVFNNNIVDY